jgi:hypothetical protein
MTPPVHAARSRQHSRATWLRFAAWPRIAVIMITATLAGGTGALAASMLAPLAASASSSQQWSGDGDGSQWSDAQNWVSNEVPQNGDSVIIAPTATEPTPDVTGMPAGMQLQDLTLTNSSLSGGNVTVAGNFSWSVSQLTATLAAPLTVQGDASFSGAGREDSQDPMTFDGTTEIQGPGVLLIQDSGPAVTNTGTLTLSPGSTMQGGACCVTPDVFLNTGTVSMSAVGTATVTGMGFDDQGAVSVGPGSLLDVTAGVGEFSPGAGIGGGGTLQFDLGAHQTLATGVSVAAGSTLTLTGNAEFFGPGTLVGGGKFSWAGGTIDGNLDVAKTIHTTISGTNTKTMMSPGSTHALLAFHGPTTVQGTGELEASAADISSSGTFTLKTGSTVGAGACCVSPSEFLSTGTLTVPASTSGTATLTGMNFNDQGAVSVGKGSKLHVTVGPGEFSPGAGLSGGGTLEFDQSAQMALATGVSIGAGTTVLQTGGATFLGTGSFTGTGSFSWTGGTINGNLDVGSGIGTTISGTATKNLTSPTSAPVVLAFHGHTTLAGSGEVELSGTTTLSNTGTLTMKTGTMIGGSSCCVSPDNFSNSGTLVVAAGTGTATTNFLQFSNSGAVKVNSGTLTIGALPYKQTAGSTQLAGGSVSAAQQMNIAAGTLSGFGTITGSVLNGGTVAPSTTGGVLKITGAYQQTSSGTLSSVITGTTPGAKFGQLNVGGTATLAGTLKASTGNGFVPAHGASFSVLLYHTRSGTFGTLSGSPSYTVSYAATGANVVYP